MLSELYHATNIAVIFAIVVVQNSLHLKDFELFACVLEVCKYIHLLAHRKWQGIGLNAVLQFRQCLLWAVWR